MIEAEIRDGRELLRLASGGIQLIIFRRPKIVVVFANRSWLQSGEKAREELKDELNALRREKPRRPVQWVPVWPYRMTQVLERRLWPSGFAWDDLESANEYTRKRRREVERSRRGS